MKAVLISLLAVILSQSAIAISLNIQYLGEFGRADLSSSYDLDISSGLTDGYALGRGLISNSRSVIGSGNNSMAQSASNSDAIIWSRLDSAGSLISSASTHVSGDSASLAQNLYAAGFSESEVSGESIMNAAAQRVGVIDGSMASSQAASAQGGGLRATQESIIEASFGYMDGEAWSPGEAIRITGGLNGAGEMSGSIDAEASVNAMARGSFEADILESKAYAAARAARPGSDAFSYISSGDSMASIIFASASDSADIAQSLKSSGSSLIYASASGDGSSEDYCAQSEVSAEGSIFARSGDARRAGAEIGGDLHSAKSQLVPAPGSWVWSGLGGFVTSNPFIIRDARGQRHIFARGGDDSLWDNLDGDWFGLGGNIDSDPYAISDSTGRVHILARSHDGRVLDSVLDPATLKSTWYGLGGSIISEPRAALDPATARLSVVGRGTGGDLVKKSVDVTALLGAGPEDPGGWSSLGGSISSTPHAIYDSDGKMHAFARASDNSLWDNVDGTWRGLGGQISSDPVPISLAGDGRYIYTYARGGDGSLQLNTFESSTGTSAWTGMGGYISPGSDGGYSSGKPSPVVDGDGRIHVYVCGGDDALWENLAGSWKPIGGRMTSNPSSVNSDGLLEVAVRGGDGSIYLAQPEIYGSWPNPTGNPIGGGKGYKRTVPRSDATYIISDKTSILSALGTAKAGDIIYVDDNAKIDLTGVSDISIPAGVTLASGRGRDGSEGGLIYTRDHKDMTFFYAKGDGVRVTGIRLQGPDMAQSELEDRMIGLSSKNANSIQVDGCEIYGWSHAAVQIGSNTGDAKVLNNYIHNNQVQGLGYGVALAGNGINHATIMGNLFDANRHSIAGAGTAGSSYEAAYNTVLSHDGGGHSFDMHGGWDRRDGTSIAGRSETVHHNTFQNADYSGVIIRGVPLEGAWCYNNWFYDTDPAHAVQQAHATGNLYVWNNIYGNGATLM